jgi:hypothetical protein
MHHSLMMNVFLTSAAEVGGGQIHGLAPIFPLKKIPEPIG